jgi:hypothetical protein
LPIQPGVYIFATADDQAIEAAYDLGCFAAGEHLGWQQNCGAPGANDTLHIVGWQNGHHRVIRRHLTSGEVGR